MISTLSSFVSFDLTVFFDGPFSANAFALCCSAFSRATADGKRTECVPLCSGSDAVRRSTFGRETKGSTEAGVVCVAGDDDEAGVGGWTGLGGGRTSEVGIAVSRGGLWTKF